MKRRIFLSYILFGYSLISSLLANAASYPSPLFISDSCGPFIRLGTYGPEWEASDSLEYVLQLKRKKTGNSVKRLEVGDKLAFWLKNQKDKHKGILTAIYPDTLEISHTSYSLEAFTGISTGRYSGRALSIIAGILAFPLGAILGVGISLSSKSGTGGTPVFLLFSALGIWAFIPPRKFSPDRFDFLITPKT